MSNPVNAIGAGYPNRDELGGTMSEEQVLPEFIATLKAAAERATPGPWHQSYLQPLYVVTTNGPHKTVVSAAEFNEDGGIHSIFAGNKSQAGEDVRFIAAASPENILKLIASLAQSEAERERLQGQLVTVLARESATTARYDAKMDQLSEMTKDRDLWQEAHDDDCPNKSMVETLHAELVRERERNQELRQATLIEALRSVESERLECHDEAIREEDRNTWFVSDGAYSRAIRDAEDAIKQLLEPAPVVTGEDGFTVVELANVMIGIGCLAIIGFIVYVAGHFIQKVW